MPAPNEFDAWISEYCICGTCVHGIDRDLFGRVYCDQADSIAGGWNLVSSRCEEHQFRDQALQGELCRLLGLPAEGA